MAFPTGWGRYCAVVIDADQVSGTSHSDFPVLVTEDMLPSEMFDADGSYPALNGGGDIRFTTDTAGSNGLHCEVVSFVTDNNPANGSAEIWVKVPSLSGSVDTTIYVWYNATGESQPAASDATFGSEGVWSDYLIAAHLKETSGTVAYDSAGNRNGEYVGALPTPQGLGQYIDVNYDAVKFDDATLGVANSFTFQLWVNADAVASIQQLFSSDDDSGAKDRNWQFRLNTSKVGLIRFDSAGTAVITNIESAASTITASTDYLITATFDNTTGSVVYVNDSSVASDAVTTSGGDLNDIGLAYPCIGRRWKNGNSLTDPFLGEVGDLRVATAARDSAWIATEYANQNSPATFAAAGTPVSAGGGGVSYDETFTASALTGFVLSNSWSLNYAESFSASATTGATLTDAYDTPSVNYDETFSASAVTSCVLTAGWELAYTETFAAASETACTLTDAWLLDYAEAFAAQSAVGFDLTSAWALDYAETMAASAATACDLAHSYAVGNDYTETFAATSVTVCTLTHSFSVQYSETFAAQAATAFTLADSWALGYAETLACSSATGCALSETYETPAPGAFDETFAAAAVAGFDLTHSFSTPAAIGRIINPTLSARGAPVRTLKGSKLIN